MKCFRSVLRCSDHILELFLTDLLPPRGSVDARIQTSWFQLFRFFLPSELGKKIDPWHESAGPLLKMHALQRCWLGVLNELGQSRPPCLLTAHHSACASALSCTDFLPKASQPSQQKPLKISESYEVNFSLRGIGRSRVRGSRWRCLHAAWVQSGRTH